MTSEDRQTGEANDETAENPLGSGPAGNGKTVRGRRNRWVVYGTLFAIAAAVLAVNEAHVQALEDELARIADERIEEFRKDEPAERLDDLKIGASVVASKHYVVLGDISGKISVFLQHGGPDSEAPIEGFEFFFARGPGGQWRQTESGRCTSEHCTQEGLRVLRALEGR